MIGKIHQEGLVHIIYCPVDKTSASGISSNRRLAVLSVLQTTMGYISKVPEPLHSFDHLNWMLKCKEIVNLQVPQYFRFNISQEDSRKVIMNWKAKEQKEWEFKFQTSDLAKEWVNYLNLALRQKENPVSPPPPPPLSLEPQYVKNEKNEDLPLDENHPEDQKSRDPVSRFKQNNNDANTPENNPKYPSKESGEDPSEEDRFEPNATRFQKYERDLGPFEHSQAQTFPIITTFKEKFTHHPIISNVGKTPRSIELSKGLLNWNQRWFEAIERQSDQNRISIYHSFTQACSKITIEIVNQLTKLKRERKFIPLRQSTHQQIYSWEGITYKMVKPNIMKSHLSQDNQKILRGVKQELENNRFIMMTTSNKKCIKVPLSCLVKYLGFIFLCQAEPSQQYKMIEKSQLSMFRNQIINFEEKINLKLNKQEVIFFTNRPQGFQTYNQQGCNIIIYNLLDLLPEYKIPNTYITFHIPPEYLFSSSSHFYLMDSEKVQKECVNFMTMFLKEESMGSNIISAEDLDERLRKYKISKELLCYLMKTCKSKYIKTLLISEMIAPLFQHLIWMNASIFATSQETRYHQIGLLQEYIHSLLMNLVLKNGETWGIISGYLFDLNEVTIRQTEFRLGYFFASISVKLGIDFDYDLLMRFRDSYFQEGEYLPLTCVKGYRTVIVGLQPEDMSENHLLISSKLSKSTQEAFDEVVTFYNLKHGQPQINLSAYKWRKICSFMSQFVPFEQEQQYLHLNIYQQTEPEHLDYHLFLTLESVIRWLLQQNDIERAEVVVQRFKEDTWFWVGQQNIFSVRLDQMLGDYFERAGDLNRAMEIFNRNNEIIKNVYNQDFEGQSTQRNLKLAKLFKLCGRHKDSLEKFRAVYKEERRLNKHPDLQLYLMIQIASLYLHLGNLEKSLYFCKEAIDFSTFQPFPTEEQQFSAYQLILRCLEVKDEGSKYKFYVDIMEEKFGETSKWLLLQQVMRTTLSQVFRDLPVYLVKKIVYFLYHLEEQQQEAQRQIDYEVLLREMKTIETKDALPKIFRYLLQKCSDLIDEFTLRGSTEAVTQAKELQEVRVLSLMVTFVGSEYVLGRAEDRLQRQKNR